MSCSCSCCCKCRCCRNNSSLVRRQCVLPRSCNPCYRPCCPPKIGNPCEPTCRPFYPRYCRVSGPMPGSDPTLCRGCCGF